MTQKELSEFLRLLAHDLQNQIGAVDLNLQILPTLIEEGSKVQQTVAPFLDRASLSTSETIETLSDLQRFAYSLAAETAPSLLPQDLSALLRDCLLLLTPKAHARNIELTLGVSSEAVVTCERDAVINALRLFATEAIRSSFPGASLTLSSAVDESGHPSLTLHSSQEGLFEAHRPNLAAFLAKAALKPSGVELQYFTGETRSAVRLLFPKPV